MVSFPLYREFFDCAASKQRPAFPAMAASVADAPAPAVAAVRSVVFGLIHILLRHRKSQVRLQMKTGQMAKIEPAFSGLPGLEKLIGDPVMASILYEVGAGFYERKGYMG